MPNDESVGRRVDHEPAPSWGPIESWNEYSARWSEWSRRWQARQQQRVRFTVNNTYDSSIVYGAESIQGYWSTDPYGSITFTPEKRIHLASPIFCQEVSS